MARSTLDLIKKRFTLLDLWIVLVTGDWSLKRLQVKDNIPYSGIADFGITCQPTVWVNRLKTRDDANILVVGRGGLLQQIKCCTFAAETTDVFTVLADCTLW